MDSDNFQLIDNRHPIWDVPRYLSIYRRYLGTRIYWIFVFGLMAGLAEGVGILMLLPLLATLGPDSDSGGSQMVLEGLPGVINGLLVSFNLHHSSTGILFAIMVAFLIKGLLVFAAFGFNAYLLGELLRGLKKKLYGQYSEMSYDYYTTKDSGHFVNVINAQVDSAIGSFNCLTQAGIQIISLVIYLTLAYVIAWQIGVLAVIIGLLIVVTFRTMNIYVRKLSRKSVQENGYLTNLLIQSIQAFKYISATNQSARLRCAVDESIETLTSYSVRLGVSAALTRSIREPIAVVIIVTIIIFQLEIFNKSVAPILLAIGLLYRGINVIVSIQTELQKLFSSIGSMELIDQEFSRLSLNREPTGNVSSPFLSKDIQFKGVYFRYENTTTDIIQNLNLIIPAKKSVAFVGGSGVGKTTTADLITLMQQPTKGKILIDGVDTKHLDLESWRSQLGYVSQDTVMFDDSIANNISMWTGDHKKYSETMYRVREAARQAYIADFIESLPEQYETQIGDRGIFLSGGQQQRLFIARELFRKPNLLILDEATSALDSESERAIQESIDTLSGQITMVIIAHRLSSIKNVDQIFVLENGQILEQGSYQDLKDTDGSQFSKLLNLQAT